MSTGPGNPISLPDGSYERLLARIQRKYRTITEDLDIGGLKIRFTRVAEPDRVLDEIVAEEDRRERSQRRSIAGPADACLIGRSYGSAAMGIAATVAGMPLTQLTRVLHLDAGWDCRRGGKSGGAQLMLADLETPALLFAKLNSLRLSDRVRVRQLNWQIDRLGERFDLILGADILYERKQWEFLNEFLEKASGRGGSILLGSREGNRGIYSS